MFLITGGGGFVGSHLAERLAREGRRVRVLDNFTTGSRGNLAAVRGDVEVIEGDVRDNAAVRRAVDGVEVVFHQAAEVSVPRSIAEPRATYDVNVGGTLNVLLAARDAGCRRVVFASSSAVYGDGPEQPKRETMAPAPVSPYASSKVAGEHLCAVCGRAYGLETVALRYFNVYGPRQDPNSPYAAVIPRFLAALRRGERPEIYGDGEQTRDFVFIADVVAANLRAAAAPCGNGSAFNVASGHSVTLNALLVVMASLLGTEICPLYRPGRPGDIRHSAADVTAARERLGFSARTSLAEGLASIVGALIGLPA
jgi:UDP-N-acetylglucosamine/UDP-N-acetyl-alpha-D-glucosaminouronate 4-epimerase